MTQHLTTRQTLAAFAGFYALCLLVQYAGSMFTMASVATWYVGLNKSHLTPPGYVFGIVWSILYALMALAATRIWRITGRVNTRPMRWWLIQLLIGLIWSMVFFGRRHIEQGMIVIALEWLAILLTFVQFRRVNHRAGWLLFPLLAWVSFASYLNFYILQHN